MSFLTALLGQETTDAFSPASIPNLRLWVQRGVPGSGPTWTDASGQGNSGTLYGSSWGSGGVVFDGVDDYVSFGNVCNPRLSDFGFMVRFKSSSGLKTLLAKSAYGPGDYRLSFGDFGEGLKAFIIGTNDATYSTPSGGNLADGGWHLALVSFKRDGLMSLYVDGALIGSTDISALVSGDMNLPYLLLLGKHNDSSGGDSGTFLPSACIISDFAFWHSAPSADDDTSLWNSYVARG